MQILSVVGNRPELLESAPVSLALRERGVEEIAVHTTEADNQELGLAPPRYRLEAGSGSQGEQIGRMLPEIESAVLAEKPDAVLVFGGSNTTLAGALAAVKVLVRVAHVGAGVRSVDPSVSEELNRVLVDRMSRLLFCPTEVEVGNLAAEGITEGVHLVGETSAGAAKIADLLCTMSR